VEFGPPEEILGKVAELMTLQRYPMQFLKTVGEVILVVVLHLLYFIFFLFSLWTGAWGIFLILVIIFIFYNQRYPEE